MTVNKNAQLRYLILDKCLRSGRKWSGRELLRKVNEGLIDEINPKTGRAVTIGKTQLYEDLKDLEYRVYKAPVEAKKISRTTYYFYSDKSFSIQNAPLNDVEINQLKQALLLVSRSAGKPEFEFVNELVPVLESKFGLIKTDKPVVSYEFNEFYKGTDKIKTLFHAIVNREVLAITYQDFSSQKPYVVSFHPYHLHQYNNRWFAFGYNPATEMYNWNLALDRIKNIEDTTEKYRENDKINWQEYFDDIIGVTRPEDGKVEKLLLHFYDRTGHYIETKPLHGSQRAKWINDQTLEVRLEVMINYELERLLLSYADQVRILKPVGLVKSIKEKLAKGAAQYN